MFFLKKQLNNITAASNRCNHVQTLGFPLAMRARTITGLLVGYSVFVTARRGSNDGCQQSDCLAGQECHTDGGHCVACRIGTYAPNDGRVKCYACPPGTHGTPNVTSPDACVACVSGRFAPQESQAECTLCPPGKYQDGVGASVCIDVVAAGVSIETCNDTHYLPSGASTADEALTPLKRGSDTTVQWCEDRKTIAAWKGVLLICGIVVGCMLMMACCCCVFAAAVA